jgi:2-iminobutanoate/2-iminopropanoate deaminase
MTQRVEVRSPLAPAPIGPYSQGIEVSGAQSLLFVSGQLPMDAATGELLHADIAAEAELALKNLEAVLGAAGHAWANVVNVKVYLTNMSDFAAVNEVYARHAGKPAPARAVIQVAALPKGARLEIEAVSAR